MAKKRKTRRRGNGEGSPYQRKDGMWCASLRVGGRRVVRYSRSREEVMLKLDQLKAQARYGEIPKSEKSTDLVTVNSWITSIINDSEAPATRTVQRIALAKIEPVLGHRALHQVSTLEVGEWVRQLKCGSRAKQQAYDLLNKAFKMAVSQRRIAANPCDPIPRPRHVPKPQQPFTVEDVCKILDHFRGHRLFGVFVLIFTVGLRQGEVLGARWSDIDWAAGVMTIRQGVARDENGRAIIRTTKTKRAVREVPLTEDCIQVLLGRGIVAKFEGLHDCDLIFPTKRGTPVSTSSFAWQALKPALRELKIDGRGLHNGRHSACTFMLRKGVPLHIVSSLLGHANAKTTSTVYSHVLMGDTEDAVKKLSKSIGYKMASAPIVEHRFRKEKT